MEDAQDLDPVLDEIEAFLKEADLAPARFGVLAVNDPTLVLELRKGRECRRSTRRRLREFMVRWRERQEAA